MKINFRLTLAHEKKPYSVAAWLRQGEIQASKLKMDDLVNTLNQKLIDQQGRYFVGDRLGLADIAVCSMLAPILEIEATPWEKEYGEILFDFCCY